MTSARRLYPYLKEGRAKIAFGLLALITVDILQLLIPRVIKAAVDALTITGSSASDLLGYAAAISGIAICIGGFRYLWRRCLLGMSRRVEEGLRNDLFDQIQTLSASYFDQTKTGDIMAHATNDIQQIRMAAGMGMVAMNDAIILGAAAIGFMSYINLELTLYVLIPMPFIVFGTRFFSRKMHQRYRNVQQSFAEMTEAVRERFAGIRVVKAYGWEQDSCRAVASESNQYVAENIKLVRVTGAFLPMMVLLTNVSMAIVLYAGGIKTMTLDITPGDLVAFINYLGLLTWPMMAMGWVTNLIQRGKASLDRIDAILSVIPDIRDRDGAVPIATVPSTIRLESVTFAYAKDSQPVIDDLDLTLNRGEALGIVGPPGGGKSTLLSLLPRLYDIDDGAIMLDGLEGRQVRLSDLRAVFSLSP
ncbi:MAG: ABC transporter transmembrane domain-containing protein, partial [Desulfobacterales bacterium]